MCEHAFVTSQGHAYSRFQRALKTGSAFLAMEAARELAFLGLADALSHSYWQELDSWTGESGSP